MNQEHKKDNFMRNLFISLGIIVIILLGYNAWERKQNEAPSNVEIPKVADNQIKANDHIIGRRDAKVVLIEYADLQCPACKAFEPIFTKIASEHRDDSFAYIYRHYPLINMHSNAMTAAKYNEAASLQNKFWEMNHVLYDKQGEWGEALDAAEKIKSYAKTLGLDMNKLVADTNSKEVENRIIENLKEANKLGLKGTPSIMINGVVISVSSEEDLRSKVQQALQNANVANDKVNNLK